MPDALAFCGSIGSGKTTLSKELSNVLGWKYISFSNYLRKEISKLGSDCPSRQQLQEFGEKIIGSEVEGFCLAVLRDVEWKIGESVVFDGVRHLEVLNNLRSIFRPSRVFLIYIQIDDITINRRLGKSGKIEDIQVLKHHSTEQQVNGILKSTADLIVNGKATIDENVHQICTWLNKNS